MMKHSFKVLIISTILAFALPAQAAIDGASTGNGSLVLTLLDRAANVSATFDLGKNYSDFSVASTTAVNYSWNLSSGTNYSTAWNTYFSSASLANTQYAITAVDGFGAGAGNTGYITSYKTTGTSLLTKSLLTAIGSFDAYTQSNALNDLVVFQNHTDSANGSSVANAGDALGSIFYSATGQGNNSGPLVMGAVGENLSVAQVVSGASVFAAVTTTLFGNDAKFFLGQNGLLSYSSATPVTAVPEPESWAMMLLGFGFLGFASRRKQVKK